MTEQKPSVGRDVHYVSRGSADGVFPAKCRAAKVTEVGENGRVGLCVLNPEGLFFHSLRFDGGIEYFDKHNPPEGVECEFTDDCPGPPGTWHWPEPV